MNKPTTRKEIILNNIAGDAGPRSPEPVTRIEKFLYAIETGHNEGLPKPVTRIEEYLNNIIEKGLSGGGEVIDPLNIASDDEVQQVIDDIWA